jgi:hypothetical protein
MAQVLLAYAFDREPDPADVARRLTRVAEHQARLWTVPVERRGLAAGRTGLYMWDAPSSPSRWPSWDQARDLAVATLYLPLGYERVVGDMDPARAAVPLVRALTHRPASVLDMTAPFVVASLEPATGMLRLITDGIGLGHLFELRFPGGWVWSNRPAATCRFAGVRAEADRDAWRMCAATGWFQGDRAPFSAVFAVPGGATVTYDPGGRGRGSSVINALAAWAANRAGDALSPGRVEGVAESLHDLALSYRRMWAGDVVIGLSGGRDSRVCVAAALAAGLAVRIETNGSEAGEAEVARRLVAALPDDVARRVTHEIDRPVEDGPALAQGLPLDAPMLPNALAWHRAHEGLRTATYLPARAPRGLTPADHLRVSGAAGEIAHGYYYPPDHEKLGDLPPVARLDAFAEFLTDKTVIKRGLSGAGRATATAVLRRCLEEAFREGLDDAKALDYFYAAQRLRRWSSAGARIGTVIPLLVPEFVQAAFDLRPGERRGNALHRAVTAKLIPQWKDEPYYQRPAGMVMPGATPRLGHAVDRDDITTLVADHDVWADAFDPSIVTRSWQRLLSAEGEPSDERLIQRVIWRAAFADYLDEVNEEVPAPGARHGSALSRPSVPTLPLPAEAIRRAGVRRLAAYGLRRVARALDP